MRTRLWSALTVVTLAALAGAAPAAAVSPLVVMDANDQVIGEAFVSTGNDSVIVRFGVQFALFGAQANGLASLVGLYYLDAACESSPLVGAYWGGTRVAPQGLYLNGQVYAIDPTAAGESQTVAALRTADATGALSPCLPTSFNDQFQPLPPPIGSLTFTPPMRIVLNPVVFQDDFALGAFTRWSSSTNP